ncbi:MAG: iron uptake system protein EfeO [Ardenticatenales bacterium]
MPLPIGLATSMLLGVILAAGCRTEGSGVPGAPSAPGADGPQRIAITITDDGCHPAHVDARTGPATFVVTNKGSTLVSEMEVLAGDRILGEVENLVDGMSGGFTLNLEAGTYALYCPGGRRDVKGTLTVAGPSPVVAAGAEDPDLAAAVTTYRDYVTRQTALLVTACEALRDAVAAGDVDSARQRYVEARPFYERVEPVAESFGDLDPAIDARADDAPIEQLTGFHRLEFGLWEQGTTDGLKPTADKLVVDVTRLRDEIPTLPLDALTMVNGANELLGEIVASKVTGEEERYSHIDLVDFEANVEGSRTAFNAVRAALARRDPTLAETVDARYADAAAALEGHRRAGAFVLFGELSTDDTRALGRAIDALGEPLSLVAAALTRPPQHD